MSGNAVPVAPEEFHPTVSHLFLLFPYHPVSFRACQKPRKIRMFALQCGASSAGSPSQKRHLSPRFCNFTTDFDARELLAAVAGKQQSVTPTAAALATRLTKFDGAC
jgi:hypothetical protein